MTSPFLMSQETTPDSKILIIDKRGIIGDALARSLLGDFSVALVTNAHLQDSLPYLHIPFKAKIPRIPDDSFSHIFLLFEGENELINLLPQFSRKAQSVGSPLVLLTSIYCMNKEKIAAIKRLAPDSLLFLYGDIGGGEIVSQVNTLFLEALTYGSLKLHNNGLSSLYPTPLPYLLGGVIGVVFGKAEKGQTYFLFSKHPVTMLSFARELKNIYPDVRLDFISGKGESLTYVIPENGEYLSFPPLREWIRTLPFPTVLPSEHVTQKKQSRFSSFHISFEWRWLAFLFFFLTILPFSVSVSTALAGGLFLKQAVSELSHASFANGERDFRYAKQLFAFSETVSFPLSLLESVAITSPSSFFHSIVGAGDDISTAGLLFVQAGKTYEQITNGQSRNPDKDILLVTDRLKRGITVFQRLEAEDSLPTLISSQLAPYKTSLGVLSATVDALPSLTGFPQKKTYLVLFQNNKELRAGGGFIGSYGLLTFHKGKIESLTLHDVYDADGQLKGHVEPPFALRRYLGASHWYLRDSNYSIDFPKNAERAQFFLQKETGDTVSGVLSIDATALEALLAITGPIPLPDYNQSITSENAFTLLETKTQDKFFPGSSQKKTILSATYTAIREKVFSEKQNAGKFLQFISQGLKEKHIMFTVNDEALEKVLATNNLSSSVPAVLGDPSVIEDFMGVNEMNLGQNKVNNYVTRALDHTVKIDEKGVLMAGTSVTLKNESTPQSLYGGDYDVYIRFITPLQSQFISLAVNNIEQSTIPAETNAAIYTSRSFKQPKDIELEKTEEKGRTLYGVHLTVPSGTEKKLTLTYALPGDKNDKSFTYQLTLFKQPGTLKDPLSVSVTFPPSFMLLQASPDVVKQQGVASYQGEFIKDDVFSAAFARKQ